LLTLGLPIPMSARPLPIGKAKSPDATGLARFWHGIASAVRRDPALPK